MILREAVSGDAPAILRLYRVLAPGDRHLAVTLERIGQIAADPNNFLFIAEEDNGVWATAFLTLCLDPMYGTLPYAVLENLVVDPECRSKGYGRFLVREIEAFCWRHHCTKMMLFSSVFRREAHQFFAHLGFARDKKVAFVKYRCKEYEAVDPDQWR
jgi:GNAT superfamily N-acetyltransferase